MNHQPVGSPSNNSLEIKSNNDETSSPTSSSPMGSPPSFKSNSPMGSPTAKPMGRLNSRGGPRTLFGAGAFSAIKSPTNESGSPPHVAPLDYTYELVTDRPIEPDVDEKKYRVINIKKT